MPVFSSDLDDVLASEDRRHIAEIDALEDIRHQPLFPQSLGFASAGGANRHFRAFVFPLRASVESSVRTGLRTDDKSSVNLRKAERFKSPVVIQGDQGGLLTVMNQSDQGESGSSMKLVHQFSAGLERDP